MKPVPALKTEADPINQVYLSVVLPVFNELENLEILHNQLKAVLTRLGRTYEIIYVDDGSTDGSLEKLRELAEADDTVAVIELRRNFGQTAALSAGIDYAHGEVVVCQDADLQNDPEDIPRLLAKLDEGYDLVSGWRKNRQDHWLWRRSTSALANWIISRVVDFKLHDIGCTLKAYRRELLNHIRLYGEMHRFIPALALQVGARVAEIPVNHHPRLHGRSKYGLSRTFSVILDLMTIKFFGSFISNPLRVFGGFGLGLIGLSILFGILMICQKFYYNVSLIQTPLLLLSSMLFILGFFCVLQGFTAELLIRTYHESQGKPTYIIRRIFRASR
jgi:glycosyltransferase involved in cell wall biosynthesis|uniref:Glycosyltransferase n=1 Tax=Desulfobacca acetoxidans TaxID=60893 RepID=A0A7C3UZ57_9BACT